MTAQSISRSRSGRAGASLVLAAFTWVTVRAALSSGLFQIQDTSATSQANRATFIAEIHADTLSAFKGERGGALDACSLPSDESGKKTVWDGWVTLDGARVAAKSSDTKVPVFGVRLTDGAAILVANHTDAKVETRVEVRLPAGLYSIERLVFSFGNQETNCRLERLSGKILRSRAAIRKPGWLQPGMASILRFTNRSAQTNQVYQGVRRDLNGLRQANSSAYRRIMVPLHECWDHVGAISGGVDPDETERVLKHIHRGLLTLAHAQSIAKNFKAEGTVNGKIAGELSADLDKLQIALTELSLGCLDLVPGVEVSSPDPSDPMVRKVTVMMANQGAREVSYIRLGAAAPAGCRVWPQEQAMFSSLKPGETVRAAFTVRLTDESAGRGIQGLIGYLAQRVPAQLSLQSF